MNGESTMIFTTCKHAPRFVDSSEIAIFEGDATGFQKCQTGQSYQVYQNCSLLSKLSEVSELSSLPKLLSVSELQFDDLRYF